MDELLPDGGAKLTPIRNRSKQIMKEKGNLEAFEILELSNEAECEHCPKYVPSGHVYCDCGRAAGQSPVIVEQLQRKIRRKFELLTTSAFFLIRGPTRGRPWSITAELVGRGKAEQSLNNSRRKKYASILDRSSFFHRYRESQLRNGMDSRESEIL